MWLGLFHGLLYLPVILILLGNDKNVRDSDDDDGYEEHPPVKAYGNMGFNMNEGSNGGGGGGGGSGGGGGIGLKGLNAARNHQSWDLPDLDEEKEENESVENGNDEERGSSSSSSSSSGSDSSKERESSAL